jgi:hypothetical protein
MILVIIGQNDVLKFEDCPLGRLYRTKRCVDA